MSDREPTEHDQAEPVPEPQHVAGFDAAHQPAHQDPGNLNDAGGLRL